jgi:hypothetical protein
MGTKSWKNYFSHGIFDIANELYEVEKIIKGTVTGAIYNNNRIICNHSCIIITKFKSLQGVENRSINNSISKWNKKEREELEETSKNFDLKYILAILNSKFAYFYLNTIRNHRIKNYFYPNELKQLPIKKLDVTEQNSLIDLSTEILTKNKQLRTEIESFHKYLISDYNIIKINKKLGEYYQLNFDELYKEVKKSYKKITRSEKDILEKEFKESLDIINPLRKEINSIDKEIDKIVYELYDLTEEEIAIIEK